MGDSSSPCERKTAASHGSVRHRKLINKFTYDLAIIWDRLRRSINPSFFNVLRSLLTQNCGQFSRIGLPAMSTTYLPAVLGLRRLRLLRIAMRHNLFFIIRLVSISHHVLPRSTDRLAQQIYGAMYIVLQKTAFSHNLSRTRNITVSLVFTILGVFSFCRLLFLKTSELGTTLWSWLLILCLGISSILDLSEAYLSWARRDLSTLANCRLSALAVFKILPFLYATLLNNQVVVKQAFSRLLSQSSWNSVRSSYFCGLLTSGHIRTPSASNLQGICEEPDSRAAASSLHDTFMQSRSDNASNCSFQSSDYLYRQAEIEQTCIVPRRGHQLPCGTFSYLIVKTCSCHAKLLPTLSSPTNRRIYVS